MLLGPAVAYAAPCQCVSTLKGAGTRSYRDAGNTALLSDTAIVLSLLTSLENFGALLPHRPAMLDATNDDDLNLAPRWACFAPSDERLYRMDRLADRCHRARKTSAGHCIGGQSG